MDLVLFSVGLALVVVIGVVVFLLLRWMQQLSNRMRAMEEQMSSRRHTENTTAALEDALAVLMRIAIEEQMQADYRQVWIKKAQEILQVTRNGPRAYQVDAPTETDRRVRYSNRRLNI